jgi:hypothetical protein
MTELELALSRLIAEIEYPPTPDLAATVSRRLHEPERRVGRRQVLELAAPRLTLRRSLVIAFVALLLSAGAVFAASSTVRNRVLEFFGLRGATVEVTSEPPRTPPSTTLELGERLSLDAVRRAAEFSPLVPTLLGVPDQGYLRRGVSGDEVTLVYRPRPSLKKGRYGLGLLVSEFRGDLARNYVGKVATQASHVERVRIGRYAALWVVGAPHYFFYRGPDGRVIEGSLRLAENALLIERGRLLVRLEGKISKPSALAIGASLR